MCAPDRALRVAPPARTSPQLYCAILSYHPEVGTFRGKRGAWRVVLCYPHAGYPVERPYIAVGTNYSYTRPLRGRVLFMDVTRRLHKGTWVNPTKLLRELQRQISQQRRSA